MTNDMTVQKNQETDAAIRVDRKVFLPAVNIYETKDNIVLMADMPGVDEKSVDITLENDVLTVQGRSTVEAPKGLEPAYAEYSSGGYRRSFALSTEQVNRDGIEATVKNGVLKVTLPKAEAAKPKRITVKAA
jgi:HSP20 family molecular chaperone IbpA